MQIRSIGNDYSNRTNSIAFKQILRNDIPAKALKGNKYILLISGPSGVGKDTIMNKLSDKFSHVVTHTTRPMREGEVNGFSYFFTSTKEFLEGIKNNEFVEYVKIFADRFYGTKRQTVEKALEGNKPVLLILDVDGAKNVKKYYKDDPKVNVISVFFRPPSIEDLKQRLLNRGTETLEAITERVGRAKYEIDNAKYYDAEIQVNNVQESVNDMKQLLHLD